MSVSTQLAIETAPQMTYVGDAYGDPAGRLVFLLHGGGQTRHAWGNTAATLGAAGFRAVAFDLRGHGDTSWAPDGDYMLDTYAEDLRALVEHFDRPAVAVGASLGGLISLLASERYPGLLSALVLVDVAPRMDPQGVYRIVSFMMSKSREGFGSLEEAADTIAEFLPHRPRPKDLSGLQKNLRLCDDGRYRWHWDPRFVDVTRGPDPHMSYERLADAARALVVPTLLVRGRLSDVLLPEAAEDFMKLVPHAEYVDVADAAHMIAGDKNDAFTGAVVQFLERSFGGSRGGANTEAHDTTEL